MMSSHNPKGARLTEGPILRQILIYVWIVKKENAPWRKTLI